MSYTKKLENEIEKRTEQMSDMCPHSQEYAATVDSTVKLMDRLNEIKARRSKTATDIATVATSTVLAMWWAVTSLKFEESGSITTSIGRKTLDIIQKIRK